MGGRVPPCLTMIDVKNITVTPISRREFAITWDFQPSVDKFSNFDFYLERSEAPHEGFVLLSKVDPSERYYLDRDVEIFKLWKAYYVRLKIKDKRDGKVSYSQPGTVEHPPNLEALELIRRNRISLENPRYGNGVPCLVFIRKEGGQRCQECYDEIKRRSTKSSCVNCYGTSYDGGFYAPISAYVNFSTDAKGMGVGDMGNLIKSVNRGIMTNYPKVKPGDVIADPRLNRLWTVTEIQNIERRRHLVKQITTLEEEERTNILMQLLGKK